MVLLPCFFAPFTLVALVVTHIRFHPTDSETQMCVKCFLSYKSPYGIKPSTRTYFVASACASTVERVEAADICTGSSVTGCTQFHCQRGERLLGLPAVSVSLKYPYPFKSSLDLTGGARLPSKGVRCCFGTGGGSDGVPPWAGATALRASPGGAGVLAALPPWESHGRHAASSRCVRRMHTAPIRISSNCIQPPTHPPVF